MLHLFTSHGTWLTKCVNDIVQCGSECIRGVFFFLRNSKKMSMKCREPWLNSEACLLIYICKRTYMQNIADVYTHCECNQFFPNAFLCVSYEKILFYIEIRMLQIVFVDFIQCINSRCVRVNYEWFFYEFSAHLCMNPHILSFAWNMSVKTISKVCIYRSLVLPKA